MKTSSYIGLLVAVCALVGLAAPITAAAAEVQVNTVQVIPPGGATCAPLQVLNVHPYTDAESNTLQSVDVTVNDPSYVVMVSSVGNTGYSFSYISRWNNPDGSVRQHLDVQATPIGTSLPITMTLLSAKTGQPVCMSVITFAVTGTGSSTIPVGQYPAPHTPTTPAIPTKPAHAPGPATSSTSTSTVSVVRGAGIGTLSDICAKNGSLELWFFLITLYLIGAAAIALREPTVPERPVSYTALLLLVPGIILLAFWIFAKVCRGAQWVPVMVFIIAIASLLAALWEREPAPRMVEIAPVPKKELLPEPPRTV